jgi:peptide/nickel transport system substrate-binding protein
MKVEVTDDYTVKLNLAEWDSTVLNTVMAGAMAGAMISPTAWKNAPGAANDKDRNTWSGNNPVGTGPFKFVSWQKTAKQVYKKWDGYWQKGKPYLDGVEWTIIVDPMTAAASFKAKEMDGLLWVQANVARELKAAGFTIDALQSGTQIKSISTNSQNPNSPFANVKVRQAISYAIDRKAIADSIFFGFAAPQQQLSLLGLDGINPNFAGYPFDVEKAKKLMAESGVTTPVKAKIHTNPNPDDVAICTAVQGMLSKIGINMEIETTETARHIQLTNVGPYDSMILCYLRANLEQPMPFMRSVGPNSVQHAKSVIQPEEVAKAEAVAKGATDPEAKKKAVWQLQQLVFGDYCIFNPIVITFPLAAVHPHVKDAGIMKTYVDEWAPENAWLDK